MRRYALLLLSVMALVSWAAAPAGGADGAPMFPFVIPWDDATPGTATDLGGLNAKPAGSRGFVVVKDGIFVEGQSGRRLRFLAVNVTAGSAFPSRADADRIAARLAKLGINLVRFHHLQNDWGRSIWKQGKTFIEVDPARVDQLDYFVAALKREGIYTNLNLSTTRSYVPELGFPASVRDIPTTHHKKVDRWNRRMIQLQKEYAAALLDHVNPYTGLAYKEEPALAFVEISNEDSITGWPGETPGQGLDQMPEPFRSELVELWNRFLRERYLDDTALVPAWSEAAEVHGPELIAEGTPLAFENQAAPEDASRTAEAATRGAFGSVGARVEVHKAGADWTVQLQVPHLTLESGRHYTLRFRARALAPRPLNLKVHLDQPDWESHGLQSTVDLTPAWQDFAVSFEATRAVPEHSRIAFLLGDRVGAVEIAGVRLQSGALPFTPGKGESLATGSVALATRGANGRRLADWVEFLVRTDRAFTDEMRSYLRKDLGIRASLIDSQIPWGGLTSLTREAAMEFADNHSYWQHPRFPGGGWDEARWTIDQRALVDEMDRGQGTMWELARWRVTGKPYTVSEYNHPAPNDYQSETLPILATIAAIQDWDAIHLFDYPETGTGRANDAIAGFFDCAINPAKVAFYPSAALILRQGLIAPATGRETLVLPAVPWSQGTDMQARWRATGSQPDVLRTRIAITTGTGASALRQSEVAEASGRARVERHAQGAVFLADAAAAKVVVGVVGGQKVALNGLAATFPTFGRAGTGFAALTLVSHDGTPIRTATRLLFTAIGRAENLDMGWSSDRTSVSDKWGRGPVHAEGVPGQMRLEREGPSRVFALDERGRRRAEVPAVLADGNLEFAISPEYRTVWYEIVRDQSGW